MWLAVRSDPAGPASLLAIADGRTAGGGGPLSYRSGDTLAYPGLVTFGMLGAASLRPGAPRLLVDSGTAGVLAGNRLRLAILAWSLQSGRDCSAPWRRRRGCDGTSPPANGLSGWPRSPPGTRRVP